MRGRLPCITIVALLFLSVIPTSPVSGEDNYPEGDAWITVSLTNWTANQSLEWDSDSSAPDPHFKLCAYADGDKIDCIVSPTWANNWTLENVWNVSMDLPDTSSILNLTIECEDNDALNDDECDMNEDPNEWKLYHEFNWTVTNSSTFSGDGTNDGDDSKPGASSTWSVLIGGYGDEDGDGISDNQDMCPHTPENSESLTSIPGCIWEQLDADGDGFPNLIDTHPYDFALNGGHTHNAESQDDFYSSNIIPSGFSSVWGNEKTIEFTFSDFNEDGHPEIANGWIARQYPSGGLGIHGQGSQGAFDVNNDGRMDIVSNGVLYLDVNGVDDLGEVSIDLGFCNVNSYIPDNWHIQGGFHYSFFDIGRDGTTELICGDSILQFNSALNQFTSTPIDEGCPIKFKPQFYHEEVTGIDYLLCGGTIHSDFPQEVELKVIQDYTVISKYGFGFDYDPEFASDFGGIGDINGDGYVDFIQNSQNLTDGSNSKCNVHLGTGSGWNSPVNIDNSCRGRIEILDWDLDGDMDVFHKEGVLLQDDSGFTILRTGASLFMSRLIDVDDDGDLDIIGYGGTGIGGDERWILLYESTSSIDTDGDGIADHIDACPSTYSWWTVDDDGCADEQLDDDNDGVSNAVDDCPNTPEDFNALNARGCSFEDLQDSDGDGIFDIIDQCNDTPSGVLIDLNGCTVEDSNGDPIPDSDGDGISDEEDQFPWPWTNTDSDDDGVSNSVDLCPETEPLVTVDIDGCAISQMQQDSSDISDDGSGDGALACCGILILILLATFVVLANRGNQPSPQQVQTNLQGSYMPPVSHAQNQMRNEIARMEQQRLQSEQEAARLRAQMANSAQYTEAKMQEMMQTLEQLKQSSEQSEREKMELQKKLDSASASTVIHNITYNIQDSAIAGDIAPTHNVKQDDDKI